MQPTSSQHEKGLFVKAVGQVPESQEWLEPFQSAEMQVLTSAWLRASVRLASPVGKANAAVPELSFLSLQAVSAEGMDPLPCQDCHACASRI